MPRTRVRPRGLGLRGRVVLSFAIGACLVSAVLAFSVYAISRSYLVGQRERSAERQASSHADFVQGSLGNPTASAQDVLDKLDPPVDTVLLLHWQGHWFASEPDAGPADLPGKLRDGDLDAMSTSISTTVHGRSVLAVGIPLNNHGDTLYELAPLGELQTTLRVLSQVLAGCAAAATVGGAGLGLWASRRVLKPLHRLAGTAAQIAGGELDTRVRESRDRDLASIITSFNVMVDSLQQRIERERRFFGDVSHELRTPLTTLITSVGVLARHQEDLPDRSRRALDLITAELDHLRRLLDDLLALARTEAGLHQDHSEPVSLRQLLTHTLIDSRRPAHLLTVETDAAISGRKLALERAFLNLMDNADRYGGGLTAVTVSRDDTNAVITVDDAGPGVPETERERIFERFATGHGSSKSAPGGRSGTGLGLALVAETVTAHGGRVCCDERPGGGARFIVTLPMQPTSRGPAT